MISTVQQYRDFLSALGLSNYKIIDLGDKIGVSSDGGSTGCIIDKPKEELDNPSEVVEFGIGSVPVNVAAKVFGKDPCWVRAGIIAGWLPIGNATRNGKEVTDIQDMDSKKGRIRYYISPKLLYEKTGYVWKGKT